jgi:2,3,4,5-tetrahydropyridine-2,6-dicarboxylate N-succinyltransferase
MQSARDIIESAWEARAGLSPSAADAKLREAVDGTLARLDRGELRVAEKLDGAWQTHQWLKKAVLLSFRLQDNQVMPGASTQYYDKVPTKFGSYTAADFAAGGFRVVPPAVAGSGG